MRKLKHLLKVIYAILSGKNIVLGQKIGYEEWKPVKGAAYWYPSINYKKPEANSSTFSEWQVERGRDLIAFATEEHALEACKRIHKLLEDYHEELKY